MDFAAIIREIGRGKQGAKSLSYADARALFAAMLAGEVPPLALGAIVLAMRVKGESGDELAGFLDATHAMLPRLRAPRAAFAPVVIPSYNGARHAPNLVPLLAGLLARENVPVLVHGVTHDPMADARAKGPRVTSAEVFEALDWPIAQARESLDRDLEAACAARRPLFVPVQVLAPSLHALLELRRALGVRNSAHSVAKLLQPFASAALRLASYTHPEYLALLSEYFVVQRASVLLSRGTEGEAVANARRAQRVQWFHAGKTIDVVEGDDVAPAGDVVLPDSRDAKVTAAWIRAALAHEVPIPAPIAQQAAACLNALRAMADAPAALAA